MVELKFIDLLRVDDSNISPGLCLDGLWFENMAHHAGITGFVRIEVVAGGAGLVVRHGRLSGFTDLMAGGAFHFLLGDMHLMRELEKARCIGSLRSFQNRGGFHQPVSDTVHGRSGRNRFLDHLWQLAAPQKIQDQQTWQSSPEHLQTMHPGSQMSTGERGFLHQNVCPQVHLRV